MPSPTGAPSSALEARVELAIAIALGLAAIPGISSRRRIKIGALLSASFVFVVALLLLATV